MSLNKFKGLGVAMVTPFTKGNKLDLESLQKLTTHLINNDADYLVVQGTTGEAATMTEDEKRMALDHVLEVNNNRLPVVLGFGGNNTQGQLDAMEEFNFDGVDALLIASPFYNKPTQKGIHQHYMALADKSPVPIILYNVPGRTGSNVLPETVVELANDHENIIGIKEASGDIEQVMEVIKEKPEGFLVISGEDPITLPIIASGGEGVISVVGNAYPKVFRRMVWSAMQGKMEVAQRDHYVLLDIIKALFADGNPGGIKELLMHMGICGNTVRPPLANVSDEISKRLFDLSKKEVLQLN